MLVKRDEFAGWIGSMEKYGGTTKGAGANRAFWLKAYEMAVCTWSTASSAVKTLSRTLASA